MTLLGTKANRILGEKKKKKTNAFSFVHGYWYQ